MRSRFVTIAGLFAFALIGPVASAQAQDDAVKKGQEVYAAQKCSVCHSIAGKGSKTNPLDGVGTKLSADDIRAWIVDPVAMAKKARLHQEAADAGEIRQAAGGRHRRAGRLHAESEVGSARCRAAPRSPAIQSLFAGAVIATVAAVVFIALALAVVVGLLDNPYAGLVVFIVIPALLRTRPAPRFRWGCGCSSASCRDHPEAVAEWSVIDFRKPRRPPHHPGGHRPERRQPGHPAPRGLRHAALDGVAVVLRPGLPRTDAPAVHRLAGERALGRALHRLPYRRGRARVPSLQAGRRAAAVPRGHRPDSAADSGRRRSAPGTGSLRKLPLAQPRSRRSRPRHSRVRRRRAEHGDDDGPAHVHGRTWQADQDGQGDSLARRPADHHRPTSRPTRIARPFPGSR